MRKKESKEGDPQKSASKNMIEVANAKIQSYKTLLFIDCCHFSNASVSKNTEKQIIETFL